jgi:hypothetical protein
MQSRTTVRLAAVSALSVLSLVGGGYAVAATGSLPGTAQQTARDALATVGVTVPGPADAAAEETSTRESGAETAGDATEGTSEAADASAKGDAVSELATSTDLEGVDKGAAIAALASEGRSQAGTRPTPSATEDEGDTEDGSDSADPAGRATTGAEASGGAATAGAGNADTHRP